MQKKITFNNKKQTICKKHKKFTKKLRERERENIQCIECSQANKHSMHQTWRGAVPQDVRNFCMNNHNHNKLKI